MIFMDAQLKIVRYRLTLEASRYHEIFLTTALGIWLSTWDALMPSQRRTSETTMIFIMDSLSGTTLRESEN